MEQYIFIVETFPAHDAIRKNKLRIDITPAMISLYFLFCSMLMTKGQRWLHVQNLQAFIGMKCINVITIL